MGLQNLNTANSADAGVDIELFHPGTGESLGIVVTMLGSDSQAYIDAERKIAKRNRERAKRTRDFSAGMDYDQINANITEKMTACFVSWREGKKPTITLQEGVELEGTKENFKKVISDRGFFWLRQQIQTGMDDIASFLSQGAKSSSMPPNGDSSLTGPTATE